MHPTIEELGEVVEVVLPETVALVTSTGGIVIRHADSPAVVRSDRSEDIAAVVINHVGEELGRSADIVVDIPAVVSSFTVGRCNLHQTCFSTTTGDPRLACGLLHGE